MYIFIVNPVSGNGRGKKVYEKLKKLKVYRNLNKEEYFTMYKGHAKKIAQNIIDKNLKIKSIIVIGGDGTLNEVVNGLMDLSEPIPIAFIPAGSGNDFRRGAKLPSNPAHILKNVIDKDNSSPYWYGTSHFEENSLAFLNCIGVGFDAIVANRANRSILKRLFNKIGLGKLVYVYALIFELIFYRPISINVHIDGKVKSFQRCFLLTVSNQPYFGGGMKINPSAQNNCNDFSLLVVDNISKLKVLFLFITVFFGKHTSFKEVNIYRGKNITIEPSKQMLFQMDGEIKSLKTCTIKKQPLPLRVKGY